MGSKHIFGEEMVGFDPKQKEQGRELSSLQCGFCGSVSGFTTRLLIQPLDVLKIRFQLQLEPTSKVFDFKYFFLTRSEKYVLVSLPCIPWPVGVYLGVRTCEVFLCFVTIMFVLSIVLTSLFSLFYVTREGNRFLHRG